MTREQGDQALFQGHSKLSCLAHPWQTPSPSQKHHGLYPCQGADFRLEPSTYTPGSAFTPFLAER